MRLSEAALVFFAVLAAGALFMAGTRELGARSDSTPSAIATLAPSSAAAPDDSVVSQAPVVPDTSDDPVAPAAPAAPAWKPAPRAPAQISLDAPKFEVQPIGNCAGPPSPGEYLALSSTADYEVDGQSQLIFANAAGTNGAMADGVRRWWVVDGAGSVAWSETMRIPAVNDTKNPGRLVVRSWASAAVSGEPVESKATPLQLGTTLLVHVVNDGGEDVPAAAITVQAGGCDRSRGRTYTTSEGPRIAFYHIDPAERAKVLVTAAGYDPAEVVLNPKAGELTAGAMQEVKVTVQSRVDFASMQTDLQNLVDGMLGWQAVAVTDLQSGRTISVNGTRQQVAGCSIKILLMIAVAQDIAAGKYTKDDVADLVYRAMGPSQVYAAHVLFDMVGDGDTGAGIRRVNKIMWDLGATHSIIAHPPGYYWEEYGYLDSYGVSENLITAEDFNIMLSKLWKGDVPLDEESRQYVLWSMTLAPGFLSGALGGPLPGDVSLYHKMGQLDTWSGTWNDVGIVDFVGADGKHYSYAISTLGSNSRWRDHYNQDAELSGVVWQAFAAAYGYGG